MFNGWYQVAYERELTGEVTALAIGELALVLVRLPEGLQAFDAHCPHRGAHLGRGGTLDGKALICPFHGRHIGLGCKGEDGFYLRGYRTLSIGGLIFVLLSERHEKGFTALMERLDQDHFFVPGFTLTAHTLPEYVMENAFDRRHFKQVHKLDYTPELELLASQHGEMAVLGRFLMSRTNSWQTGAADRAVAGVNFFARVYSPTLCVTELSEPEQKYIVLTAATPTATGDCDIRVSLAVPPQADGSPPRESMIRSLLRDSRTSLEQDIAIWENVARDQAGRFAPDDNMVLEYYKFCHQFSEESSS